MRKNYIMKFNLNKSFNNFFKNVNNQRRNLIVNITSKESLINMAKVIVLVVLTFIVSILLGKVLPNPSTFIDKVRSNMIQKKIDSLISLLRSLAGASPETIIEINKFSDEVNTALQNIDTSSQQLSFLYWLKKLSFSFLISLLTYLLASYGLRLSGMNLESLIQFALGLIKTGKSEAVIKILREGNQAEINELLKSLVPSLDLDEEILQSVFVDGIELINEFD